MSEELGWPGIKAICESFKAVNYSHLGSLRLWKTYIEDEGVRAICEFLVNNKSYMSQDIFLKFLFMT